MTKIIFRHSLNKMSETFYEKFEIKNNKLDINCTNYKILQYIHSKFKKYILKDYYVISNDKNEYLTIFHILYKMEDKVIFEIFKDINEEELNCIKIYFNFLKEYTYNDIYLNLKKKNKNFHTKIQNFSKKKLNLNNFLEIFRTYIYDLFTYYEHMFKNLNKFLQIYDELNIHNIELNEKLSEKTKIQNIIYNHKIDFLDIFKKFKVSDSIIIYNKDNIINPLIGYKNKLTIIKCNKKDNKILNDFKNNYFEVTYVIKEYLFTNDFIFIYKNKNKFLLIKNNIMFNYNYDLSEFNFGNKKLYSYNIYNYKFNIYINIKNEFIFSNAHLYYILTLNNILNDLIYFKESKKSRLDIKQIKLNIKLICSLNIVSIYFYERKENLKVSMFNILNDDVNIIITIIKKLLSIYYESYDDIKKIFLDNFPNEIYEKYNNFTIPVIKNYNLKLLDNLYQDKYSIYCQKKRKPTLTTDIKTIPKGLDYMKYPYNQNFYFYCTNKNYPYPGLSLIDDVKNNFLFCCFKKPNLLYIQYMKFVENLKELGYSDEEIDNKLASIKKDDKVDIFKTKNYPSNYLLITDKFKNLKLNDKIIINYNAFKKTIIYDIIKIYFYTQNFKLGRIYTMKNKFSLGCIFSLFYNKTDQYLNNEVYIKTFFNKHSKLLLKSNYYKLLIKIRNNFKIQLVSIIKNENNFYFETLNVLNDLDPILLVIRYDDNDLYYKYEGISINSNVFIIKSNNLLYQSIIYDKDIYQKYLIDINNSINNF